MPSFFSLLKQHGLKMGLATFLGYAAGFVGFYGVMFILMLVPMMMLGGMAAFEESLNPEMAAGFGLVGMIAFAILYIVMLFFSLLFGGFLNGGIYGMGTEMLLENRSGIGDFFLKGFRFMWRLTGQSFLMFLIFIPVYILLIPLGVGAEAMGDAGAFLMLPVFFAVMLVPMSVYLHAPALLVREDLRVWASIKRAFRVAFSSFGSSVVSVLLYFFTIIAINLAYAILAGVILGPFFLLQVMVHEGFMVLTGLVGLPLGLGYAVIILPLSVAAAHILVLYRYEKHIRRRDDFPQAA
ncbi:hypothetical protein C8P63_113108 [Melghirimyces profundicolus]|uniref:Glycerophosphoryl diester phosphodiesterase membrane domain-containing protein n=1 Tax=Melghirimyces profundicolus TaxID=1242148 RepID=A0A2T6BSW0_9BACL|nr:hypothetical protein [Melghirimyces profundicolus]PTX59163.1 hypothetical protein C8P63_113108 [Melghirimyces profundicolus]